MLRQFRAYLLCWIVLVPSLLFSQTYQDTFNHARDLLKQKQYAQALDEARQAIHQDNTRWEGWYVAGTAAVGLEKYDLAIDYFQEALSRCRNRPRIPSMGLSLLADKFQPIRPNLPQAHTPPRNTLHQCNRTQRLPLQL